MSRQGHRRAKRQHVDVGIYNTPVASWELIEAAARQSRIDSPTVPNFPAPPPAPRMERGTFSQPTESTT